MGRNDNFITGILVFLMILIFGVTVYFCLDIFGIIEVPEQYSIATFLGTRVSELSVAVAMDETITDETIDEWINAKRKVVDDPYERDGGYGEKVELPEEARTPTTPSTPSNPSEPSTTDNPEPQETVETPEQVEQPVTTPVEDTPRASYQNENVVNRMYYSQLDAYGKLIYLQFNEHREELMKGTYTADFGTDFNELLHEEGGDQILENAFQLSINSLMFDNPDLFYLDITKIYMSTEITTLGPLKTYRVKIGPAEGSNYLSSYFQDEQMVWAANSTLESFRQDMANQIAGLSDYDKIKTIHDYIIQNTEYDQSISRDNIYNIYGTLMQHVAVCEGYSKAMKYILDAANIPCVIACGIAQNSSGETESHAWNYIKIDGAWYAVDSTWDDPVILGTGYISDSVYTKYFLKGSDEFFQDHFEDGNIVNFSSFAYPTISKENYIR